MSTKGKFRQGKYSLLSKMCLRGLLAHSIFFKQDSMPRVQGRPSFKTLADLLCLSWCWLPGTASPLATKELP